MVGCVKYAMMSLVLLFTIRYGWMMRTAMILRLV